MREFQAEWNGKFAVGKTGRLRSYPLRMKKQMILMGCVVGLFLTPAMAADDETPLAQQMESMNDAFKGFRRETDPVKGATEARAAQTAALKAALEIPIVVKEMPAGPEKDKAANEYRMMMGKLYIVLCEVEASFLTGKVDGVAKIVENLKELKKSGHEKFVKEEE